MNMISRVLPHASKLLEYYGIFLALIAEVIIFTLFSDRFLTYHNQINVLRQSSINAIIAVGMTFVILSAGIDLSVGSVVALSGVISASLLKMPGMPVWVALMMAVLGGFVVGAVSGAFSGLVIVRFRIPPFIATLAMMTILRGLAFIYTSGRPIWGLPRIFDFVGRGHLFSTVLTSIHPSLHNAIPFPVVLMAVVFFLAYVVLNHTIFGRYVYAIGGNEEAARLSGVRTGRIKLLVYTLSGVTAAISGLILASRLGSGQPNSGIMFELDAIAAVVVGGTSLKGGRGTILGTLIGVLIIGELNNGLNLVGVQSYMQKVILGLVILLAVLLDHFKKRS